MPGATCRLSRWSAPTVPEALNAALREVLDAMPTMLYGDVLGVRLDAKPTGDPLAATTVQFAALVSTSLTTKEAAKRLNIPESRIRQMTARRTLYSVLLNSRRRIPAFQFAPIGGLVPNITKVNAALPEDLHPVEVQAWYTQPHVDLFLGDDVDARVSPLDWLRSGGEVNRLAQLARWL